MGRPSKLKQEIQIETIDVSALIPYAKNARTHSPEQIAQIAASIREFGFTNPVLIDADGGIIAGHGRVLAAHKLGQENVPCLRLSHLTETQKRAYIIADNKIALNAGWDDELLAVELDELRDADFDITLLGFEAQELNDLIGTPNDSPEDGAASGAGSLAGRFMIPPFSVLNAREGWWQDRKRAWLALGIKSELGRGGGLTMQAEQVTAAGLNYYRDENKQRQAAAPGGSARRQRQAAAPGPRATTAASSAATAQGGQ